MSLKPKRKLSETIPGGIYLEPNRGYVNANGEPINADGTKRVELCDCTFDKPLITVDFVPKFFIHSTERISKNGNKKTIEITRVRRPKQISTDSATKKANEFYDQTENLKETDKLLGDWIDEELKPKKGRPSGSKNKSKPMSILNEIEKYIWDETAKDDEYPKIKDVAKRFKMTERTLRRMIQTKHKKNWKQFVKDVSE